MSAKTPQGKESSNTDNILNHLRLQLTCCLFDPSN